MMGFICVIQNVAANKGIHSGELKLKRFNIKNWMLIKLLESLGKQAPV